MEFTLKLDGNEVKVTAENFEELQMAVLCISCQEIFSDLIDWNKVDEYTMELYNYGEISNYEIWRSQVSKLF